MGAHRIFFQGFLQIRGLEYKNPPAGSRDAARVGVWVRAPRSRRQVVKIMLKYSSAERFSVTTNAQNTLQHFQRGEVPPLAHVCGRRWGKQ